MLEILPRARRNGALTTAAPAQFQGVSVRPSSGGARFSLRVAPQAGDAALGLDLAVNKRWTSGDRFSARLGPDEWLIGGPEAEADELREEIERALVGRFHSLVDVSHRNVAIEISGALAVEALNAGCPLDLSDAAFPAGTGTRTLLGKAEIVLMRPGHGPVFHVECWRSFAPYVFAFLVQAARTSSA